MSDRLHSVFIIGAGFSKPAGMPLGNELFAEIYKLAKNLEYERLERDIERFLDYQNRVHNRRLKPEDINLEDFVSFLDIEHYLRLLGSDTDGHEGSSSQIVVRELIARILHGKMQSIPDAARRLYTQFVTHLEPGDFVVTFNYDTILETFLDELHKPYRLVPDRVSNELDESEREVIILKMHGSIDWFDIEPFKHNIEGSTAFDHYQHPGHPIFNDYKQFWPKRIADRYYNGSPLGGIYRVERLEGYFDHPQRGTESPLILSPSFNKILYMNPLRDLWYGFGRGLYAHRLAIIGYSLPLHGEYIRQPVALAISDFQEQHGQSLFGQERLPLRIVDRRTTQEELKAFQENYSFVDWDKAKCHFSGFDRESIDFLFKTT